jgi:hypothetical protein
MRNRPSFECEAAAARGPDKAAAFGQSLERLLDQDDDQRRRWSALPNTVTP